MERLTDKHYTGKGYYLICDGQLRCPDNCDGCEKLDEAIDRLGAYEDTGLEPEEAAKIVKYNVETKELIRDLNELMAYRMAEQEGRLPVLPCKVGGTAFYTDEDLGRVLMGYIASYEWLVDGALYFEFTNVESDIEWVSVECPIADFGKTVFLTREEAVKALKGGGSDGQ